MIDAAPLPVASRIAKCPVPVDETINDFTRHRIASQDTMVMEQGIAKRRKLFFQPFWRIIGVVQVNIEFAKPITAQFGQRIDVLGAVLILWEEERMTRVSSVNVPKLTKQPRIVMAPLIHSP